MIVAIILLSIIGAIYAFYMAILTKQLLYLIVFCLCGLLVGLALETVSLRKEINTQENIIYEYFIEFD